MLSLCICFNKGPGFNFLLAGGKLFYGTLLGSWRSMTALLTVLVHNLPSTNIIKAEYLVTRFAIFVICSLDGNWLLHCLLYTRDYTSKVFH